MSRVLAVLGGRPLFEKPYHLTRPTFPRLDEITPLLARIRDSRWLTNNGSFVQEFEQRLAQFLGVDSCSAFCNGSLALCLAVRALGLTGEVITTPFTFPATPHALDWNGIVPVFADVDPETFNLDPDRIEPLITERTTAILPVHVFGNPCDVEAIERVAARHRLKVLYDAAHAFNVTYRGRSILAAGDASILSFHATKVFNTLEGGAVVCSDEEVQKRLRLLRNCGILNEEVVVESGLNGKLNEVQAAIGLLNLQEVSESIERRRRCFERYRAGLGDLPGIAFQKWSAGAESNFSFLVVRIDADGFGLSRDEVYAALRLERVMVRKYFYPLCSTYSCYSQLPSARSELLPEATRLARSTLALPLFDSMEDDQLEAVVDLVRQLHACAVDVRAQLRQTSAGQG